MDFKKPASKTQTAWDVMTGQAEPVTATPHGWYNTPENPYKPHLDATTYRSNGGDLEGLSLGMGAWDGPMLGDNSVRALDAHLDVGRYKERDGTDAYGVNLEGGLLEYQDERREFGLASASARANVSSKGAVLGLQADGPQAAFVGKESGTASDEMRRGGFSPAGPGAELRAHWADEDGDGHRELGFGADLGDFSFDFTTEDPLRSLARTVSNESIGGRKGASPGDGERNWTSEAIDSVSNLFGHYAD
jgi:hypothetical protein